MPGSIPLDVVESYLLGIMSDSLAREAVFKFRTPDGRHTFAMTAHDVEELSVNEFLKQNIVHQVRVLGSGSNLEETRNLLANLLFDKPHAADVTDPTLLAELDKRTSGVMRGQQVLVELEPVYGASALVLAGSVAWDGSTIEAAHRTAGPV